MFLLSACGNNSTPQVAPDRAAFNAAVVAFDITTDATTLTAAELAFAKFIADFPNSSLIDDAYYYIVRSIHELANKNLPGYTFAMARTEYDNVSTIAIPGLNSRLDDTAYLVSIYLS